MRRFARFFSMSSGKAPSLDEFTVGFFKKIWIVVGEDLCVALNPFF